MTALSTSALAALARLESVPHQAAMIFTGYAGEPPIIAEDAKALVAAGFATLENGRLHIIGAGRKRLEREREWKK